jgi:hypothetical protein
MFCIKSGRDFLVGVATRYMLDGLGGLNSGGGKRLSILRTSAERPLDAPGLLYNGYRGSFPGVKRPGRDVDHLPQSVPRLRISGSTHLFTVSLCARSAWHFKSGTLMRVTLSLCLWYFVEYDKGKAE